MLDDYMQKYGAQYTPKYLIDNSAEKWGKEKYGIIISRPECLMDIPKKICILLYVIYTTDK